MATTAIVKNLDVVKDIRTGKVTGLVDAFADTLFLQAAEEGFRHRVDPTIPPAAHAGLKVIGLTETLPVIATVLATLIGMHKDILRRLAPPDSHHQSIQNDFTGNGELH